MGLSRLFLRRYRDAQLRQEIDSYIEIETEENLAKGMRPREARAAARRKFGNQTRIREEIYEANSVFSTQRGVMGGLLQDLRITLRNLLRKPATTLGTALILGLGVGATTTIYAVVDGVMLRPLPYQEPSALVTVGLVSQTAPWVAPGVQNLGPVPTAFYQYLRERGLSPISPRSTSLG